MIRRLFVLRLELYGMASLNSLAKLAGKVKIGDFLRQMSDATISADMAKIYFAYLYACTSNPVLYNQQSEAGKVIEAALGMWPGLTEADGRLMRFCKLFSPSYCPWTGTSKANKACARVLGAAMALEGRQADINSVTLTDNLECHAGSLFYSLYIAKVAQDDPSMCDMMKQAMRGAAVVVVNQTPGNNQGGGAGGAPPAFPAVAGQAVNQVPQVAGAQVATPVVAVPSGIAKLPF